MSYTHLFIVTEGLDVLLLHQDLFLVHSVFVAELRILFVFGQCFGLSLRRRAGNSDLDTERRSADVRPS